MEKDKSNEKIKPAHEPIVIPDECGDSMGDKILEQPAFVHAVRSTAKAEPEDKKLKSIE